MSLTGGKNKCSIDKSPKCIRHLYSLNYFSTQFYLPSGASGARYLYISNSLNVFFFLNQSSQYEIHTWKVWRETGKEQQQSHFALITI